MPSVGSGKGPKSGHRYVILPPFFQQATLPFRQKQVAGGKPGPSLLNRFYFYRRSGPEGGPTRREGSDGHFSVRIPLQPLSAEAPDPAQQDRKHRPPASFTRLCWRGPELGGRYRSRGCLRGPAPRRHPGRRSDPLRVRPLLHQASGGPWRRCHQGREAGPRGRGPPHGPLLGRPPRPREQRPLPVSQHQQTGHHPQLEKRRGPQDPPRAPLHGPGPGGEFFPTGDAGPGTGVRYHPPAVPGPGHDLHIQLRSDGPLPGLQGHGDYGVRHGRPHVRHRRRLQGTGEDWGWRGAAPGRSRRGPGHYDLPVRGRADRGRRARRYLHHGDPGGQHRQKESHPSVLSIHRRRQPAPASRT